ncbi:MAG: hypothetical protein ACLGHF_05000 [Alphaproteobacteria bacterium]
MPNSLPVYAPAGFAPVAAIGFTQADATLSPVSALAPLPVLPRAEPAAPPLAGTTSSTVTTGPFLPVAGRPVVLSLSGSWSGTVRLMRSTDGGTTQLPLTAAGLPWASFTANCCEAVWEESTTGAELYLNIALVNGTLAYRLEQ